MIRNTVGREGEWMTSKCKCSIRLEEKGKKEKGNVWFHFITFSRLFHLSFSFLSLLNLLLISFLCQQLYFSFLQNLKSISILTFSFFFMVVLNFSSFHLRKTRKKWRERELESEQFLFFLTFPRWRILKWEMNSQLSSPGYHDHYI